MAIDYSLFAIPKGPSRFATRKKEKGQDRMNERVVYAHVTTRDDHRCRVCGKWCNPEAVTLLERAHHHHLQYRSAGGLTTIENVCLVCPDCHEDEHSGKIQLSGDAELRDPVTRRLAGIKVERSADGVFEVIAWV